MIAAARQAAILDHLRRTGFASVADLARLTGASGPTIRRDLTALEAEHLVSRSHGGAALGASRAGLEPDRGRAPYEAAAAKQAIGQAAAALVSDDDSVLFDSGSTVHAAAAALLAAGRRFTAVTNDLAIAAMVAERSVNRVIVLGGVVRSGSATIHVPTDAPALEDLSPEIALIGAHGVDAAGCWETAPELAALKRRMIRAGRRVALLADATKFGARALVRVAPFREIDELVTDAEASGPIATALGVAGTALRRAETAAAP